MAPHVVMEWLCLLLAVLLLRIVLEIVSNGSNDRSLIAGFLLFESESPGPVLILQVGVPQDVAEVRV